jgi:hypothetical protein
LGIAVVTMSVALVKILIRNRADTPRQSGVNTEIEKHVQNILQLYTGAAQIISMLIVF